MYALVYSWFDLQLVYVYFKRYCLNVKCWIRKAVICFVFVFDRVRIHNNIIHVGVIKRRQYTDMRYAGIR